MRRSWPLLALVLTACASSTSPSTTTSVVAGPAESTLEERLIAEFEALGADFPVVTEDAVWVVSADRPDPAVVRIDPESNEVVAEVHLSDERGCNGVAYGFGAVWACFPGGVARIDPATNEIVAVVDADAVGQAPLAAAGDSVWAFGTGEDGVGRDALLRIDPNTNTVSGLVELGHEAQYMIAAFDALWVSAPNDGVVLRVDPASNEVTVIAEGLVAPSWLAADGENLWVTLNGGAEPVEGSGLPTVVEVDPETGEVLLEVVTSEIGIYGSVAADDTTLWVRTAYEFLLEIDPVSGETTEKVIAPSTGGAIALGHDSVWTTSYDVGRIWRLTP